MPAPEQTAPDRQSQPRHLRAASYSVYPPHVNRWAIIVGISQYQHEQLNLKFADRDAEELYKLLQTPSGGGFEADKITKLVNEDATTAKVQRALRSFLKKPAREDIVLLYFACHGAPDLDRPSIIYLLTYDTDPDDVSGTALPMREIDLSLKENLLAERVVIIADTCHSAAIGGAIGRRSTTNEAQAINAYLEEVSKAKGGVALLTSAEASETAQEGKQWGDGHGVFTHFLLEGMRGAADGYNQPKDGIVTAGELFDYVRESVKKATNYQQHPAIGTNPFDRNLPIAITGGINAQEHYQLGCRLYELGWMLGDPKRFQAAARQFRTAIELSLMARSPFPEAALGLGQALLAADEYDEAIHVLSTLTERHSPETLPAVLFYLGLAYAKRREDQAAAARFEEFVARCPQDENAAWLTAYIQQSKGEIRGRKLALLIGINQYAANPTIPNLQGCVNDVRLVKNVLTQHYGFSEAHVFTLVDQSATHQGILDAFQTLNRLATPVDTVLVHYSGHSVPESQPEVFGAKAEGVYLIVHDTTIQAERLISGIGAVDLHHCMSHIPAECKVLILDTHPNNLFNTLVEEGDTYNLFLASDSAEIANEHRFTIDGKLEWAGLFTGVLTDQLAKANRQILNCGQLIDTTIAGIQALGYNQTPLLIGERDQFIFTHEENFLRLADFARQKSYEAVPLKKLEKQYARLHKQATMFFPQVHASFGRAFLAKGAYSEAGKALETALHQGNGADADVILALGTTHICMRQYATALRYFQQYATVAPEEVKALAQMVVEETQKISQSRPHALLIGVNDYLDSAIPPVRGAVNDALVIKEVLLSKYKLQPEHITVLLNHHATRAAILEAFKQLVETARDEPAIFYFAGHGSTIRNNKNSGGSKNEIALVSTDSRLEDVYDIAISELIELAVKTPNLIAMIDAGWTDTSKETVAHRTIPSDTRERPIVRAMGLPRELTGLNLQIGGLSLYPKEIGTIFTTASFALEAELPNPQGDSTQKFYGRFTHALVQYLWQTEPTELTYTQLIEGTKAFAQGDDQDKPLFFNHTRNAAILQLVREIEQTPIQATIVLLHRLIEQREQQGDLYPEGRLNVGIAYAAIKDYDKGIGYLERAVALYSDPTIMARELEKDPNAQSHYYEARYQLGRVLFESERDFSRAVSELTEATTKDTKNVRAFYYLGQAIREMVERETLAKAEAALQTYLVEGAPLGHEDEVREFLGSRKKPELTR